MCKTSAETLENLPLVTRDEFIQQYAISSSMKA